MSFEKSRLFDSSKYQRLAEIFCGDSYFIMGEYYDYVTTKGVAKQGVLSGIFKNKEDKKEVVLYFVDGAEETFFNLSDYEPARQSPHVGLELKFKSLADGATLPTYETDGAVGMDLKAVKDYVLTTRTVVTVSTGLAVEVPAGYELQIRARSSFGKKGIILTNGVGTIDQDYRGEIGVMLLSLIEPRYEIKKGDRIGQAVLCPVTKAQPIFTDKLSKTKRGAGAYGSTGR